MGALLVWLELTLLLANKKVIKLYCLCFNLNLFARGVNESLRKGTGDGHKKKNNKEGISSLCNT